jgi:hypothetical protein
MRKVGNKNKYAESAIWDKLKSKIHKESVAAREIYLKPIVISLQITEYKLRQSVLYKWTDILKTN